MSRSLFDDMLEVGRRARLAPHLFLCLDFDGTLTPPGEDPALTALSPEQIGVLRSLAAHPPLSLAVITGRERAELQALLSIPGLIYAGNHGLEISGPGFIFIEPGAVECRTELQKLAGKLTSRVESIAGVLVEDKGLTLSVNYHVTDPGQWEELRQVVHSALANTSYPFHLTQGNMVFEIRPRVDWSKGDAVTWIMEKVAPPEALPVYLGDDATDEDVFAALPNGITVKVGGVAPTTAQYGLDSPAEAWRFLAWLDEVLCQPQHLALVEEQ